MADMEKDMEKDFDSTQQAEKDLEETVADEVSPETESLKEDKTLEAEVCGECTEENKNKSKFFKKKEKKKDPKDEKIEELSDRLIRSMAEFDNFRKRTEKEKSQMFETGAAEIIEKILPVIDDFERGLAATSDEEKTTSFAQGIEMVYKKLMSILADLGVQPIEAVGKVFDPMFHNAVMQTPSDEYDSGVVVQELQKGYIYKDRIVRHSMVMVAE